MQPSPGVTMAASSVWVQGRETAAAATAVTIWREEPAWSAPSAKMVSCQLSYSYISSTDVHHVLVSETADCNVMYCALKLFSKTFDQLSVQRSSIFKTLS